jgi:hypothetical protein
VNELCCVYCYDNGGTGEIALGLSESELTSDGLWLWLQRNYRFFFMFLSSTSLLCVFVFAMCALYIKILMDTESHTVWKALARSPAAIVLMVYTFISVWFVGGLTVFHLYLIGTNQVPRFLPFCPHLFLDRVTTGAGWHFWFLLCYAGQVASNFKSI